MHHCLYYSVKFNESKEKFKTVVGYFLTTKNNVAPSLPSSNFPLKLIIRESLMFFFLDESIPMSLYQFWCYEKSNTFPIAQSTVLDISTSFSYASCLFFTDWL